MMCTGTWRAGIRFLLGTRAAGLGFYFLLAVLLLSACGRPPQPGNEAVAAAAATDFLEHLVAGRANQAWEALTPTTRARTYDNDAETFAVDVASADWSSMQWRIGPVSNYDISWGVYVEVVDGDVPAFLTDREIAGEWSDGVFLLVQIHEDGSYAVAGQSMDEAPAGP